MGVERFRVQVDGQWHDVAIERVGQRLMVTTGEKTWEADLRHFSDTNLVSLILGSQSHELLVDKDGDTYTVQRGTVHYHVRVKPAWAKGPSGLGGEQADGEHTVESPLIGLVVDVPVKTGQKVEKGDIVAVIEAMKMQNEVRSPRAGTVKSVKVRSGQKVASRQALVVLG